MNRRETVLALLAIGTCLPSAGLASPARACRIGVLSGYLPRESFAAIQAPLLDLGYEPGRSIEIEYRFAQGREERLPGMAAELVAAKVDLIVALLNPDILAARRATSTIPIVMTYSSAPVQLGFVASLARPGGNVTGTTIQGPETAGKILEVLRDALPRIRKVAYLWEPEFPGMELYRQETERAGAAMGLQLTGLPVRNEADLETAFTQLSRQPPDALYVVETGAVETQRARVIAFAARLHLPAIYTSGRRSVLEGGLITYSTDYFALARRTAAIIDRICQGAKPSEIPVEQPTSFQLMINRKTARALGITFPQSLMLRVDEAID